MMKRKSRGKTKPPEGRRLDWEEYSKLCQLIARRAKSDLNPDAVVGIARGGAIVGATVSSLLQKDFFPIKFSRRVNEKVVRKRPKLIVPPTLHLEGKKILLLDDVSVTGETMRAALRQIQVHRPDSITTAVLVRQGDYSPDYYAIYSKEKVTFPWQIDDEEWAESEEDIPK
jgi:hypoxanthine phosphoribosyltransferase